jgi:hypothetical protein
MNYQQLQMQQQRIFAQQNHRQFVDQLQQRQFIEIERQRQVYHKQQQLYQQQLYERLKQIKYLEQTVQSKLYELPEPVNVISERYSQKQYIIASLPSLTIPVKRFYIGGNLSDIFKEKIVKDKEFICRDFRNFKCFQKQLIIYYFPNLTREESVKKYRTLGSKLYEDPEIVKFVC